MRKFTTALCASLLTVNASATQDSEKKNPELWVCESVSKDMFNIYFVYLDNSYMFFDPKGNFLGSGDWNISQQENGKILFHTQIMLQSGYHQVLMQQLDDTRFHLQVLFPELKLTSNFICK